MSKTEPNPQQLEIIPKSNAEKLEGHAKFIRTCVKGQRKGAAEIFGYAFLAGHRMLQAKKDVPHGNSDPNAGLKKWAEANFKDVTYRTLARWMEFARGVSGVLENSEAPAFKRLPLMLNRSKIKASDRPTILRAVLEVMDGKGMLAFMRDSRLLNDAITPEHNPRKKVSPDQALAAKQKQAAKLWKGVTGDLTLGEGVIKHLPPEDRYKAAVVCASAVNKLVASLDPKQQSEFLDVFVESSNAIRARQKKGAS